MGERHKFFLLVLFGVTIFWFVIILLCLPESKYLDRWNGDYLSTTSLLRKNQARSIKLPELDQFKKLFASQSNSTITKVLYYDFNTTFRISLQEYPVRIVSKSKHEADSLSLVYINNQFEKFVKTRGDKLFSFNLLASNRIGIFRPLPDTRPKKCKGRSQLDDLSPSVQHNLSISDVSHLKLVASIIICYYNEAPSALLRTIQTILIRSPPHLIKEILIVDDFSAQEYHIEKIQSFVHSNLIRFIRLPQREGLIRARLHGADMASGDVLIFLDSHVEANEGWLEPLMETVQNGSTTIACPMIDLINAETLVYSGSPMVKGGLTWALHFRWDSVASNQLNTYEDFTKPIESPTMAGGLYAISRDFFYHLGAYDPGMELWGGENIELSLRTWMCGGKILILPCSRLGHIFRKERPYGPEPDKPDSLLYNSHRTARVWLDEYLYKYYESVPEARQLSSGDVTKRSENRKRLMCNNFQWFLDNIYTKLKENLIDSHSDGINNNSGPKLFNTHHNKRVNRGIGKAFSFETYDNDILRFNDNSRPPYRSFMNKKIRQENYISPRKILRFQIKTPHNDLCVESKNSLLAEGLSRLVLNHCARYAVNDGQDIISNNSNLIDQLWTETELHDYRLRDNQCLDLNKNLPLLRKCRAGSFQNWTRLNQTVETHIVNSDGGLCLSVERIHIGEPIIVTLCDTKFGVTGLRERRKVRRQSNFGRLHNIPDWRTGSLFKSREPPNHLKHMQPSQRWTLIVAPT